MCVIALKRSGFPLPSDEILKQCWDSNPDGGGFMFAKDGKVHIRKGFMKFKKMMEALAELPDDIKNGCMILHFRIGTHGAVSKECTHPFPVCDSYEQMRLTESVCDVGMAHNGVISFAASQSGVTSGGQVSDSMWFAKNVANGYMELIELDDDYKVSPLMSAAIGYNKFAFLRGDGYAWTVGDWGTIGKDLPVWYSNTSWEKPRYQRTQFHDYTGTHTSSVTTYSPPKQTEFQKFSSKRPVIIAVTPEEHAILKKKIETGLLCSTCVFHMQLKTPCNTCLKGKSHPCYSKTEEKKQKEPFQILCEKCEHLDTAGGNEPCATCVTTRKLTSVSPGYSPKEKEGGN